MCRARVHSTYRRYVCCVHVSESRAHSILPSDRKPKIIARRTHTVYTVQVSSARVHSLALSISVSLSVVVFVHTIGYDFTRVSRFDQFTTDFCCLIKCLVFRVIYIISRFSFILYFIFIAFFVHNLHSTSLWTILRPLHRRNIKSTNKIDRKKKKKQE